MTNLKSAANSINIKISTDETLSLVETSRSATQQEFEAQKRNGASLAPADRPKLITLVKRGGLGSANSLAEAKAKSRVTFKLKLPVKQTVILPNGNNYPFRDFVEADISVAWPSNLDFESTDAARAYAGINDFLSSYKAQIAATLESLMVLNA